MTVTGVGCVDRINVGEGVADTSRIGVGIRTPGVRDLECWSGDSNVGRRISDAEEDELEGTEKLATDGASGI